MVSKTDVKNYDFLEFSLKGKFDSEYINTNANYIYNAYTKDGFSVAPFFDVNYLYSKADDHELDTMIGDERFYQYFSDFRQKTLLASAGVGFTQELNKLSLYFAPRIQQEIINDGSEFVSHFGGSRFSIDPDDKKDMYLALSLGVNLYVNDRLSLGFNINGKQKISNRDKEYQNINGMLKVKYNY
ncbi:autotransporter outer membrane beta-barrel domain-containing protein [Campylobacter iguaniorum]|uniref:autotransporter outer membrane beta-barrel domain-containing protein n=1 Tax=Campylobacter iguaniorum TaxID=1244531 RepID=UPI00056E2D23|nr:autotransporter outer membrane beta-barrel domain-containing protein [Campylobacter iguaniorum]